MKKGTSTKKKLIVPFSLKAHGRGFVGFLFVFAHEWSFLMKNLLRVAKALVMSFPSLFSDYRDKAIERVADFSFGKSRKKTTTTTEPKKRKTPTEVSQEIATEWGNKSLAGMIQDFKNLGSANEKNKVLRVIERDFFVNLSAENKRKRDDFNLWIKMENKNIWSSQSVYDLVRYYEILKGIGDVERIKVFKDAMESEKNNLFFFRIGDYARIKNIEFLANAYALGDKEVKNGIKNTVRGLAEDQKGRFINLVKKYIREYKRGFDNIFPLENMNGASEEEKVKIFNSIIEKAVCLYYNFKDRPRERLYKRIENYKEYFKDDAKKVGACNSFFKDVDAIERKFAALYQDFRYEEANDDGLGMRETLRAIERLIGNLNITREGCKLSQKDKESFAAEDFLDDNNSMFQVNLNLLNERYKKFYEKEVIRKEKNQRAQEIIDEVENDGEISYEGSEFVSEIYKLAQDGSDVARDWLSNNKKLVRNFVSELDFSDSFSTSSSNSSDIEVDIKDIFGSFLEYASDGTEFKGKLSLSTLFRDYAEFGENERNGVRRILADMKSLSVVTNFLKNFYIERYKIEEKTPDGKENPELKKLVESETRDITKSHLIDNIVGFLNEIDKGEISGAQAKDYFFSSDNIETAKSDMDFYRQLFKSVSYDFLAEKSYKDYPYGSTARGNKYSDVQHENEQLAALEKEIEKYFDALIDKCVKAQRLYLKDDAEKLNKFNAIFGSEQGEESIVKRGETLRELSQVVKDNFIDKINLRTKTTKYPQRFVRSRYEGMTELAGNMLSLINRKVKDVDGLVEARNEGKNFFMEERPLTEKDKRAKMNYSFWNSSGGDALAAFVKRIFVQMDATIGENGSFETFKKKIGDGLNDLRTQAMGYMNAIVSHGAGYSSMTNSSSGFNGAKAILFSQFSGGDDDERSAQDLMDAFMYSNSNVRNDHDGNNSKARKVLEATDEQIKNLSEKISVDDIKAMADGSSEKYKKEFITVIIWYIIKCSLRINIGERNISLAGGASLEFPCSNAVNTVGNLANGDTSIDGLINYFKDNKGRGLNLNSINNVVDTVLRNGDGKNMDFSVKTEQDYRFIGQDWIYDVSRHAENLGKSLDAFGIEVEKKRMIEGEKEEVREFNGKLTTLISNIFKETVKYENTEKSFLDSEDKKRSFGEIFSNVVNNIKEISKLEKDFNYNKVKVIRDFINNRIKKGFLTEVRKVIKPITGKDAVKFEDSQSEDDHGRPVYNKFAGNEIINKAYLDLKEILSNSMRRWEIDDYVKSNKFEFNDVKIEFSNILKRYKVDINEKRFNEYLSIPANATRFMETFNKFYKLYANDVFGVQKEGGPNNKILDNIIGDRFRYFSREYIRWNNNFKDLKKYFLNNEKNGTLAVCQNILGRKSTLLKDIINMYFKNQQFGDRNRFVQFYKMICAALPRLCILADTVIKSGLYGDNPSANEVGEVLVGAGKSGNMNVANMNLSDDGEYHRATIAVCSALVIKAIGTADKIIEAKFGRTSGRYKELTDGIRKLVKNTNLLGFFDYIRSVGSNYNLVESMLMAAGLPAGATNEFNDSANDEGAEVNAPNPNAKPGDSEFFETMRDYTDIYRSFDDFRVEKVLGELKFETKGLEAAANDVMRAQERSEGFQNGTQQNQQIHTASVVQRANRIASVIASGPVAAFFSSAKRYMFGDDGIDDRVRLGFEERIYMPSMSKRRGLRIQA